MGRDDEGRQQARQTGPWVLALGVLAVGTVALARELRRNREKTVTEDS
ncbi:hypothetical protein ACFFQF_14550 [Haladaptatus pallidirubidus]|uniref:Uncharacterized protein n=1 Tax=Haladaptatus pallidirubidus TaxID=1008152 RepID=A0AAV3UD05_9EURY|nr:hypothetical protein [Haladaptatus pallidirubidus]